MKHFGTILMVLLIALLLSAGCTQSAPAPLPQPVATAATTATPVITPVTTVAMQAPVVVVVTVIHNIVPTTQWKDSELHITFSAPQNLAVTTHLIPQPEGSQGLKYQTDLIANDIFYIRTFPISLNDDQAYRDTFRAWDPTPVQTTVTINGITFDRFESTRHGKTHVGYVAQKASASDIGFSSVLVYTADTSIPFEREDFETIVASFAYFTKDQAATMPGNEIPRIR